MSDDTDHYELIVSDGVEGPCVYLNDFRIAGPKPWGGGETLYSFKVSREDLYKALELADA